MTEDRQLELDLYQEEFSLDGHIDTKGIRYIGSARKKNNGKWNCLADVDGALCVVELTLSFPVGKKT